MAERGPYGTNLGDIWLGEGSHVQNLLNVEYMQRLIGGDAQPGLILIHEVLVPEGATEAEEVLYVTSNLELIQMAVKGHKRWLQAQGEAWEDEHRHDHDEIDPPEEES